MYCIIFTFFIINEYLKVKVRETLDKLTFLCMYLPYIQHKICKDNVSLFLIYYHNNNNLLWNSAQLLWLIRSIVKS